ncbi:MAG: 6,7-dimethyl-8-ribityllumazine synthase [Verrucomicrobiales bacterium]|nr:6,7-dimethyl-8-ribityllumazine synthase [Verrucomicrobiales bacterium]|tara:strand:- start:16 stop:501 length:486 start_codon:yes stop_codon:yes gene_type:complete
MLQESKTDSPAKAIGKIAVITSEYNGTFVGGMLGAALDVLKEAGTTEVEQVSVPGAFEIPVVCAQLARRDNDRPSAVICLGVIIRGETTHADHIGVTVSRLLGQIAAETGVPVIHEVLLLENEEQARQRCLNTVTNRGTEAAYTALKMAQTMRQISNPNTL